MTDQEVGDSTDVFVEPATTDMGPGVTRDRTKGADRTTPPGPRLLGVVAATGLLVAVLDQASKHWALSALQNQHTIDLVGSLRFNLAYNTGTAFSFGSNRGLGPWISVLAIVVVVGLSLGYTSRFRLGAVSAGLIAGGAVGNLVDRAFRGDKGFLHGAVIDFVDLQWWPIFNVADAAICVGAGLLIIASFRAPA